MNYLEIDEKNIQSFDYEKTIVSNGKILGACELGKAEIQLLNNSNEYSSYKNNWIKTQFGSMYIHDVKPVQEKVNISLSCYDIKYKLDVKYDKKIFEPLFPCSLLVWREAIATYCEIEFADGGNFANANYILDKHPFIEDGASCRNVIGLIAEAGTSAVDTDDNDHLYFVFNEDKSDVVNDWLELTTEKEKTQPVNVVVLGRGDIEDIEMYPNPQPENPKELRIDNNYILDPQDTTAETDRRKEVIEPIYNRVNGFSYIPFELRTQDIDNKLGLKLGQKIIYQDIYDNEIEAYLMTISYKYLGGDLKNSDSYEVTLSAEELSETNSNYSYAGTPNEKLTKVGADVDKLNKEIKLYVKTGDLINQINLSKDAIVISGNRLIVDADNLDILEDGTLICNNATIKKGNLILEDDGTEEKASMKIKTTKKFLKNIYIETELSDAYLYQNFGENFNFNEMPGLPIITTDNNYQVRLKRTILGSIDFVRGYIHEIIVTNNNDYEETIYKVTYDQIQERYETNINVQEIKLPAEFGKVKTIDYEMYANYLKKLLINAGITSYSSEGIEADIYSNYKYTIDDLKKVYEYILGNVELTPEEFAFLDANGDGKINVQDMILIERDGGLYNISDSQPGKFKITTHNANENIQIFDKDGNPIISTGIVGTKVSVKNHPFLYDTNELLNVGEALSYYKNEYLNQSGMWISGKLINRIVYEIDYIDQLNQKIDLDKYIENFDELINIYGSVLTTNGNWNPINSDVMGEKFEANYNSDTGLSIKTNTNIQKGYIVIEFTS